MRYLILASSLILTGCGGVSDTVSGGEAGVPRAAGGVLVGRVELDQNFAGASVELSVQGQPLKTVKADDAGFFRFEMDPLPTNFRVEASGTPPGARQEEAYAAEYRNFDATRQSAVINPLTNLLVAYGERHPEVPPDQARARLKRFFEMGPREELETHMALGHRRGFGVRRYLVAARSQPAAKGTTSFVAGLVDQIHASTGDPLPSPVPGPSALPPPIPVSQFTQNLFQKFEASASQLAYGTASAITAYFSFTLQDLKSFVGPAGTLTGWAVGFFLQGTGLLSNPTTQALNQILSDLSVISTQIVDLGKQIATEITDSTYNTLAATLTGPISDITSNMDNVYVPLLPPNTPTATQAQQAQTKLANSSLTNDLLQINQILMGLGGSTGLLELARSLYAVNQPFLGNSLSFDPLSEVLAFYMGYQTQAVQMIIEAFHGASPPNLSLASTYYNQYCQQIATQRSQLPVPLDSDRVLYNRATGLLIYPVFLGPDTPANATALASTFQAGNYTNWRVATSADYNGLFGSYLPGKPSDFGSLDGGGEVLTFLSQNGFNVTNCYGAIADNVGVPGTGDKWDPLFRGNVYYLGASAGATIFTLNSYVNGSSVVVWPSGDPGDPPVWNDSSQPTAPYLLVADASSQCANLPNLAPALGQLTSLTITNGTVTNSTMQLTAIGNYTVNTTSGTPTSLNVDVTSLVAWSSSNNATAQVQNYPCGTYAAPVNSTPPPGFTGPFGPGQAILYQSAPVTFTASLLDSVSNTTLQATSSVNVTVPAPVLQGIQISPGSLNYLTRADQPVQIIGYYSDGSTQDMSANTTWSASPTYVSVVTNGGLLAQLQPGAPSSTSCNLTATTGNLTDTIPVFINLPAPAPSP